MDVVEVEQTRTKQTLSPEKVDNSFRSGPTSCHDEHERKFLDASDDADVHVRIKKEADDADDVNMDVGLPFPFETDQAALKDNKDYQSLIRAVVVLESQRIQALKDYETLIELQQRALQDPINFVDNLQRKVDMGISRSQTVVDLPSISWERYSTSLKSVFESCGSKHLTRRKIKREIQTDVRDEKDELLSCKSIEAVAAESEDPLKCLRTGIDPIKSESYNHSWTVDEQRHLESLLVKYPPERFESRRWFKIAQELGNRTPQQVASRVQKYFIKLAKLGLPIPGRMPNLAAHGGKNTYHRHQRYNRFYYPSSTFMASYEPPVFMSEEDSTDIVGTTYSSAGMAGETEGHLRSYPDDDDFNSDSEERSDDHKDLLGYLETSMPFGRSKAKYGQKEYLGNVGHMCTSCRQSLVETYWSCVECLQQKVVLCNVCSKREFSKGGHKSNHLLERTASGDATSSTKRSRHERNNVSHMNAPRTISYLDSNYMPRE